MRLDRFLTLYLFHPWAKRRKKREEWHVPILMYHSISDDPENGIHPYYRINTSQKIFAEQMKFLYENNYSVITLNEAVKIISADLYEPDNQGSCGCSNLPVFHHSNIPQKKVVLTFDDGYRDFYIHAFPILNQFGFTPTVFLPTDFISGGKPGLKGKEHLSWGEVKELHSQGVFFGSHTVSHPQLKMLIQGEIEREIRISKETIEDRVGCHVDSFSYPYQFPEQDKSFIRNLKNTLLNAGYRNGVSTRIGTAESPKDTYFLKRLPINSDDTIPFFQAKLEGGYDWLNKVQLFWKQLKGNLHLRDV